jgi:hypothetical protein
MKEVEAVITLKMELANDLSALETVKGRIGPSPEEIRALAANDPVVAQAAFELHNYYCVSENLMRRIAVAFENALDPSDWHRQLLSRMALAIEGVRPALLDKPLRARLDELRKFRHFFRNAYDRPLDPKKLGDLLALLAATHDAWLAVVRSFSAWLDDLARSLRS